ncbi:MAG: hypothetical protein CTY16_13355 [Methylobacter sp.]|nr:MAG: hypothetical protein CTY16_13355 [Methylobacter sp.]
MKIYAVVVTYNGAPWIEKCLDSLARSSIPVTTLAIDNASADGTPGQIKTRFPGVELIETGSNLGFGKANNLGLLKALENDADYVFLLNQDAWIEPDTIAKLIEVSQQRPEFGILSPLHMNGAGTALDLNFSYYVSPGACPKLISDWVTDNLKPIYETQFVNAAAWLISRQCLTKVGGFDPIFPHYGEDDDYLNRTLYHGLKIGIVPHTKIYHDRMGDAFGQLDWDTNRLFINNIVRLKTYPNSFIFNLVTVVKEQLDILIYLLLLRDFSKFIPRLEALVKALLMIRRIKKAKDYFAVEGAAILTTEKK